MSLLHLPCPSSKASSGISSLATTSLPSQWVGDIISLPFMLGTRNCFRPLWVDRSSYIICEAQGKMKMLALVQKSLISLRGSRKALSQVWGPVWLYRSLTHDSSLHAVTLLLCLPLWGMSVIMRYFFLSKAQGCLFSVAQTFLEIPSPTRTQPGVGMVGVQGPLSEAHGTQAAFFLLIFLPPQGQTCGLHQVWECDSLGFFLFFSTYFV